MENKKLEDDLNIDLKEFLNQPLHINTKFECGELFSNITEKLEHTPEMQNILHNQERIHIDIKDQMIADKHIFGKSVLGISLERMEELELEESHIKTEAEYAEWLKTLTDKERVYAERLERSTKVQFALLEAILLDVDGRARRSIEKEAEEFKENKKKRAKHRQILREDKSHE